MTSVLVVGAGVSGLTCAVRLLEAGHDVTIWTRDMPARTTSAVAAATWYPYRAFPSARVGPWAAGSLTALSALADEPGTGVTTREGIQLFPDRRPDPWWRDALPSFGRADGAQLPPGYADGYSFRVPVIEMPVYLEYLLGRAHALGADLTVRAVVSLDDALAERPVVVNCSGLGARDLVADPSVHPIRGQVVRIAQPGIERITIDEDTQRGLTYIVPRSRDVVLGGTVEEDEWSLEPDPRTAEAILERCARLEPRISGATILSHAVGLRPGRSEVRLEAEARPGGLVVHNYGHGGSGVTLSWGCADEVVAIVEERAGTLPS